MWRLADVHHLKDDHWYCLHVYMAEQTQAADRYKSFGSLHSQLLAITINVTQSVIKLTITQIRNPNSLLKWTPSLWLWHNDILIQRKHLMCLCFCVWRVNTLLQWCWFQAGTCSLGSHIILVASLQDQNCDVNFRPKSAWEEREESYGFNHNTSLRTSTYINLVCKSLSLNIILLYTCVAVRKKVINK